MSRTRLTATLIAFFIAIPLIAMAVPRLAAGILTAPFDETVREIARGETVSRSDLRFARASRLSALDWYAFSRFEADLGILNYTLARMAERGTDTHRKLIEGAIEADLRAISLAPTAAYSWLRLAQAQIERDGRAADISPYLRMSYSMARYDPRVVLTRLDIALLFWNDLPEDLKRDTDEQIRLAMKWFPRELVRYARARNRLSQVRAALSDDPQVRASFNLMYFLRRDQT
tara:strand:+ start:186034 stop:186726 length:693 start_codon:yes stop_codon:yes gene_type:complete